MFSCSSPPWWHDLNKARLQKCPIFLDTRDQCLPGPLLPVPEHSRTQSPSYVRSTERDKGLWPNPYQTGIWLATTKVIVLITYIFFTMFLWYPVLDLARAPRRTARKKDSGYENGTRASEPRKGPGYEVADSSRMLQAYTLQLSPFHSYNYKGLLLDKCYIDMTPLCFS
jgi:hypothetical protein